MKAIRIDDQVHLADGVPAAARAGEALVRVILAGICNTDIEITRGYAGFKGTLGHEFVGEVVESPVAAQVGQRVVGEINAGCGRCELCHKGDSRHCADRTVLGIKNRDGAFAEFLSLPPQNLFAVPRAISDLNAVFTEPLAAACQILEQVEITPLHQVVLVGDGKLSQLIVRVLANHNIPVTVIGKHTDKLDLARAGGAAETLSIDSERIREKSFDIAIDASGSRDGLARAIALVKPRGTVVLKSTHQAQTQLHLAPVVVDELTIVGSRCGRFAPALDLLASGLDLTGLISDRFPLERGVEAITAAAIPGLMKVLLEP